MRIWIGIALLLVLALSVSTATAPAGANAPERHRERLLELTNQYRVANGRAPLFLSDALSKSAQNYAEQMARLGFFGHDAPTGSTMTTRIEAGGYSGWSSIGENLGAGYKAPDDVFNGWLASPTHRENILNPAFREIGIGYSTKPDSPYVDYWVETFGARPGTVAARSATKPRFVFGFEAFAQAVPDRIGQPLEDVWHLGQTSNSTLAIQRTEKGILLWIKPTNQMIFVTESQALSFRDGKVESLSEAERQIFGAIATGSGPTPPAATPSEEIEAAAEP